MKKDDPGEDSSSRQGQAESRCRAQSLEKAREEAMDPREAARRLQAWVARHGEALAGISAVDAIREARGSL